MPRVVPRLDSMRSADSAIMQLRLCLEPCSSTGTFTQIASMLDDGNGSTGKGTLRELSELCLGVHNGASQRGYAAVVRQEVLVLLRCLGGWATSWAYLGSQVPMTPTWGRRIYYFFLLHMIFCISCILSMNMIYIFNV